MTDHDDNSSRFPEAPSVKPQGSVECLGMTFKKRREAPGVFLGEAAREAQGPGVPQD